MQSNLGIEKTYQVVQFEPLKVTQSIEGIPQEQLLDEKAMSQLAYYLMLDIEVIASMYFGLLAKTNGMKPTEEIAFLEEEKKRILSQLKKTYHITLGE